MTSEELERAIDFLLKSQARFDTRLEAYVQEGKERQDRTDEQIAQTNAALKQLSDRLDALADTQMELVRVLTKSIEEGERFRESQKRINESLVRVYEALAKSQSRTEEAQALVNESMGTMLSRSEEAQARINESLGASIGELAAKQSKTEEALARLADAQAQSERSLDRLTRIVEEERGR